MACKIMILDDFLPLEDCNGAFLSKKACQVLFFELYHHTCYRDNIPEFKEIMKVIREVANGKEG